MFLFTLVGVLFEISFVSTFTSNSTESHGGLFEGRGLIVKKSFGVGAYSRGKAYTREGDKSRTYGIQF